MKRMITVKKNRFSKSILRAGLILISIFYLNNIVASSNVNKFIIERNPVLKDTLYDKENGNIYVLDKNRIFITAYDKKGKVLWRTDPVKDAFIRRYRTDRPVIISFEFGTESVNQKSQAIWIRYNNSQFGYLLKKNGKFRCQGQD